MVDVCTKNENKVAYGWRFWLFLWLSAALPALYAALLHTRGLPPTEGWYTYYAQCIWRGWLPYRDFEYLYPPFYIYFMALLVRVLGTKILLLRRFGVLLFALIGVLLYLVAVEVVGKRRCGIAFLAALAAAFYMQSEIVQIFYDYVRVMDLFNLLAVFLLLRAVRALQEGSAVSKKLLLLGTVLGILLGIKQNTGLLMLAFCLVAWVAVAVFCHRAAKRTLFEVSLLLAPVVLSLLLTFAVLFLQGALAPYFAMVWGRAAGAKGGMAAVLFGWLVHNGSAFLAGLPLALLMVGLLLFGCYAAGIVTKKRGLVVRERDDHATVLALVASAVFLLFLLAFCLFPAFTKAFLPRAYLSTYTVFLAVVPLFVWLFFLLVRALLRGAPAPLPLLLPAILAGAYLTLSFACGNSGGLADGQAYFGICFLVLLAFLIAERALLLLPRRRTVTLSLVRATLAGLCVLLALQSAGKKMATTYSWWGLTEASYWQASEVVDLPLLQGLRLSPETAALYRDVAKTVKGATVATDTMLCFPHVPLFYSICERVDCGLFTKVQWFDVASDEAVRADMARISEAPPRILLIYHTPAFAYEAHERSFRGGAVSAMRDMERLLFRLAKDRGYTHKGDFVAHGNRFSLYILP